MALFGMGKKREPAAEEKTPVEDVLRLRQQGLNNNQIIQTLQKSGYKIHQIFDAINQSELKLGGPELSQQEPMPEMPEGPEFEPLPEQGMQQTSGQYGPETSSEQQIEELAEAIIDEKWREVEKDIRKVVEWKTSVESRMRGIEQKVDGLKQQFDELHNAVLSKVSEYDKNIVSVGTEIKAMEKVFKKVLPTLTENVNKLSRMTRDVKKK